MQHREGRSIAVSKKRVKEHKSMPKTCPPQNFNNTLVKKNYTESDISIRISGERFSDCTVFKINQQSLRYFYAL